MSIILDALKKLEKKRQQGAVPDLTTIHSVDPGHKTGKRSIWTYLILIALLLNAAIFIGWLKPWDSETQLASTEIPSVEQEKASPDHVKPDTVEKTSDTTSSPVDKKPVETGSDGKDTEASAESEDTTAAATGAEELKDSSVNGEAMTSNAEAAGEQEEPSSDESGTAAEEPVIISPEPIDNEAGLHAFLPDKKELDILRSKIKEEQYFDVDPSSIPPQATESLDEEQEPGVIEMSQLPPDIKKELPEISINAHIYSNSAASRMVSINGNIIREGETVTSGLTLKKITASGIILTYKDHHFRIRAF